MNETMMQEIKEQLENRLDVAEIETKEVSKENEVTLQGVVIKKNPEDGFAYTIYVNPALSVEKNIEMIAETFEHCRSSKEFKPSNSVLDIFKNGNAEDILRRVIPCLVNRYRNTELFKRAIHKPFLDLEIIYRVVFSKQESCMVSRELCEHFKIDENTVHERAIENASLHSSFMSMASMLVKIMREEKGLNVNEEDFSSDFPMYVVTNDNRWNGAGSILCPDIPHIINRVMGVDKVYAFPSSRHEFIVIPADGYFDLEEAKLLVRSVNATEVDKQDFLSDNVYIWNISDGKLDMEVA